MILPVSQVCSKAGVEFQRLKLFTRQQWKVCRARGAVEPAASDVAVSGGNAHDGNSGRSEIWQRGQLLVGKYFRHQQAKKCSWRCASDPTLMGPFFLTLITRLKEKNSQGNGGRRDAHGLASSEGAPLGKMFHPSRFPLHISSFPRRESVTKFRRSKSSIEKIVTENSWTYISFRGAAKEVHLNWKRYEWANNFKGSSWF